MQKLVCYQFPVGHIPLSLQGPLFKLSIIQQLQSLYPPPKFAHPVSKIHSLQCSRNSLLLPPTPVPKFTPVKHSVVHCIDTNDFASSCSSSSSFPRALHVDKQEFDHMIELGIVRPSTALGLHPSTWCPRKLVVTGDHVVTNGR